MFSWLTAIILGLDEMLYMYVNGIYMYAYDNLGNGGKIGSNLQVLNEVYN